MFHAAAWLNGKVEVNGSSRVDRGEGSVETASKTKP